MALWLFPSPQIVRIQRPLEPEPVFSLWTRVHRNIATTLTQLPNGTWEEWPDVWPQTRSPRNKFFFSTTNGDGGCFNTMGSDQSAFVTPLRLYIGGHQYIIGDTMRAELLAAVTPAAPSGYGAFIVAAPPGAVYTGDEITLSGWDEGHKPAPVL